MRRFLQTVVLLAWALWLGGMIVLFLFVMRLFTANRDVATQAAPVLFQVFAAYQLTVGMIACAGATVLALMTRQKSIALTSLLMIAALGLALVIRSWTAEMLVLDRVSVEQVARFQQLHHNTTTVYSTAAVLLFLAGIGWVLILTGSGSRQRARDTARAIDSAAEAAGQSQVA